MNLNFTKIYYGLLYYLTLIRLRKAVKRRKIRVGFWVTEVSKWSCEYLYQELKNDEHFEPFILLSYYKNLKDDRTPNEHYEEIKKFFKKNNAKIYSTFSPSSFLFKDLREFEPDIIFYQQPWQIHSIQRPEKTHKKSLLCYIPYCFYSMDSELNYLPKFHGLMWKYFVETDLHKQEYLKKYNAKNCISTGSVKLDEYNYIDKNSISKSNKKVIIYAPHHSFNDGLHDVATFKENGEFILDLAKSHTETEWIFRPHPAFDDRVLKNKIMTKDELNNYYSEWAKIGRVSAEKDYYKLFCASDLLITDCISFLTEYAPTLKPVIHLRKDCQKEDFNSLVKKIDESYYQVYSNDELINIFNEIIVNNNDYLKNFRQGNKELLSYTPSASKNIYDYLKKELKLK